MKAQPHDARQPGEKFALTGWGLFTICAILFIIGAFKNGDWWTLSASFVFLVACIVFMIPLVFKGKSDHG